MADLKVKLCGIEFKNPIIAASGTFGFGREYDNFYDISILGGVSVKGLTKEEKKGNPPPRIAETYGGILNSVGLQNPGVLNFIKNDLPFLRKKNIIVIANIAGATVDDYEYMAKTVDGADVDMVELNISCPNVSEGGLAFGAKPSKVLEVTKKVRALTKKPLMVKLTPNVTDIAENAKAAEEGGADCISLINTISGMAVDADTKKAVLKNNFGGLSGAAIKPIALKMVHTVYKAVKIPVVGMGGIMSAKDVIEFMLCGATCVQVGTANLLNPLACFNIIKDLNDYLNSKNIQDISDLIGGLILN